MSFGSVIRSAGAPWPYSHGLGMGGDANRIWHLQARHGHGEITRVTRAYELSTVDFSVLRFADHSGLWDMGGIGGDVSKVWMSGRRVGSRDISIFELSASTLGYVRRRWVGRRGAFGVGGDANVIWQIWFRWFSPGRGSYVAERSVVDLSVVRSALWPHFPYLRGIGGNTEVIWAGALHELSTVDFSIIRAAGSPGGSGVGGDEKTIWSCSGDQVFEISTGVPLVPKVTTHPATEVSRTSARAHGEIIDVGAGMVAERGFEWGTSPGVYPNSVTET